MATIKFNLRKIKNSSDGKIFLRYYDGSSKEKTKDFTDFFNFSKKITYFHSLAPILKINIILLLNIISNILSNKYARATDEDN